MDIDVLYCDNHLLVIHKPAGLLAQADETGDLDVLVWGKKYLARKFNKTGNVFLGLVHRLDRPVSGVMVLARTSKAAARLTDQFKKRTVEKRYLAVVEGSLKDSGSFNDHLLKDGRKVRVVPSSHPKGKHARLSWKALDTGAKTTLVDVELETGRPHQIRIQFASRGHALVGDLRYDAETIFDGRNLALHSYVLGIEHPTQRKPMRWVARPPESWNGFHDAALETLFKSPWTSCPKETEPD